MKVKSVRELSREQLVDVKASWYEGHLLDTEGRLPTPAELASIESVVSDDVIFDACAEERFADFDEPDPEPVKKVLWLSRHNMTEEQAADLRRILGEYTLTQYAESISDFADIANLISAADVICAVFPLELMAQLKELADDRPVLTARTRRERAAFADPANPKTAFEFVHDGWTQILRLEYKAADLNESAVELKGGAHNV